MAGPLGGVVTLATKGLRAALEIIELGMRVPGRASAALLQGVYQLPPDAVARARRAGGVAAAIIAIVTGVVLVTAVTLRLAL